MKRYFLLIAAAAFAFMACNKENNAPEPEAEASEYYDYQTLQIPSGTDKILIDLDAPVSNSAGHTKFPTFSRITKS